MTKSISLTLKNEIIKLLNDGLSFREIAKKVSVSLSTIAKIKKQANLDIHKKIGGAPRKISTSTGRSLIRGFKTNVNKTVKDAVEALKKEEVFVCGRTVRRMLNSAGMKAEHKPKVLPLTPSRKKARLSWAKVHQNWTVDDWKNVVFSDETKINRIGSDGAQWFWNATDEEIRDCHLQHLYKHGGGNIMLWGCFLWEGPGYIVRIDSTMDSKLYCDILSDDLTASVSYYNRSIKDVVFQQDNDPKHTSKMAKNWFQNNDVRVLDWPSYSPDLNPIENLWAIIKKRLCAYETAPKSLTELFDRITQEWDKIAPKLCQDLIISMPKRIEAVINAKGGRTKY